MLTLDIQDNGSSSSSFTFKALVSPATCSALGASWSSYVLLRYRSLPPVVFRLEISAEVDAGAVRIDHWPATSYQQQPEEDGDQADKGPVSGEQVHAQCVCPSRVRVVQYMELVPAAPDQPKLALAFIKKLLRQRIIVGADGIIALQYDGIDYGQWRFKAYYRGRATLEEDGDKVETLELNAGIVDAQTLVLLFPFASSQSALEQAGIAGHKLQPVGAHGESFRELVAMALQRSSQPSTGRREAVSHSRSILLHGPSGAGKTTLVQLVASHFRANLLTIDCSLLSTPHIQLQDLFTAALRIQPAVLLLEDLELLFPRVLDETKYKLAGRLVGCTEAINDLEFASVAVVGTVTSISALHSKVRQLFAEEVPLEMPEKQWAADLLSSLLPAELTPSRELLLSIAMRYGQRPSNIASIARQIRLKHSQDQSKDQLSTIKSQLVLESEIESFAREISSGGGSASTLVSSVPDVSWSDIGGLENVKQSLLEMVVWPLERPQVFLRMGISPPLGMILHGPPGTGKTMLAKAAASASGCNFLSLSASDLMKAEFGESEKAITRAFDTARALSPCMVFIDEFQSLFGNRSTAGVLLMEMDNLKAVSEDRNAHVATKEKSEEGDSTAAMASVASRVFVLVATNALSAIDPAFLQPGRFENVVYVGLPRESERRAILEIQKNKMPWHGNVDLEKLVNATDGANAASLVALCQAAAIHAMQRGPTGGAPGSSQFIEMDDFFAALETGNFDFQAQGVDEE